MRDPAPSTPLPDYPTLDHAAARRIVLGVLLTMMLAALDSVMVATALPTIAASLGDIDNMSWVVTANLLSATAVDAAVRQALRHPRPAHHDADRDRHLCGWARSPARWRRPCWC